MQAMKKTYPPPSRIGKQPANTQFLARSQKLLALTTVAGTDLLKELIGLLFQKAATGLLVKQVKLDTM